MPMPSHPRYQLLGSPVDAVTLEASVRWVEELVTARGCGQHASLNAGKLVRFKREPDLVTAVSSCDLVTADGQAVVWAARLLGCPLPERVAGIDLMMAVLERAEERGFRVYLLGAREEVLAQAEREILRRHPRVIVAGRHHGYFGKDGEEHVVGDIAAAAPDILFVALETPEKELFLARYRDRIRIPFSMGVGGSFDVLAGHRRRAPLWMQRIGFEWLFRLVQEPRRLARRYLVGNSLFLAMVLRELARTRARGATKS